MHMRFASEAFRQIRRLRRARQAIALQSLGTPHVLGAWPERSRRCFPVAVAVRPGSNARQHGRALTHQSLGRGSRCHLVVGVLQVCRKGERAILEVAAVALRSFDSLCPPIKMPACRRLPDRWTRRPRSWHWSTGRNASSRRSRHSILRSTQWTRPSIRRLELLMQRRPHM